MVGAAAQIHQSLSENEEFELDIPLIHVTYLAIQARLVNFSELVQAFPNVVGITLKLRERLDVGEMVCVSYFFMNQHSFLHFFMEGLVQFGT